MRVRRVAASAAVLLALAGLSACRTKVGAAAYVDGKRISQGDVNKYLQAGYTMPSATPGQQQQNEPPRILALDTMIESRLLTELLGRSLGGVPTADDLSGLHDKALAVQLQLQLQGSDADKQLNDALVKSGVTDSFTSVFLRNLELKQAVIDKINATSQNDIAAAIKKLGVKVSVNERYGSWSADTAALTTYTPDYLKLGPDTPSASAPAGG